MKLLVISAFAAASLLVTGIVLRSPAANDPGAIAISIQDLHSSTDLKKLPIEEFDDQSLVYSRQREMKGPT